MKKIISSLSVMILILGFAASAKAAALIDIGLGTLYDGTTNASVKYDNNGKSGAGDTGTESKLDQKLIKSGDDTSTSSSINLDGEIRSGNSDSNILSNDDEIIIKNEARSKGSMKAQENANTNAFENASGNSAIKAASVITKSDLEIFASTTVANDENVDELRFSGDKVEVGYKEQGKFLGLFKATYKIHVIVHADGTVDVKYPWYAFLLARDKGSIQTEINRSVTEVLGSQASTTGSVSLTANEAAEVAAAVREILFARFGAGLGITGSSTTATSTASSTSQ